MTMIEKLIKLLKIKLEGELVLKDGTPIIVDGDLAVGANVSVQSPDGVIPLPDGSYELETGQIITVEGGTIKDIIDQVEAPEEPDQTPPVEAAEPPVEAPPAEEVPVEDAPEAASMDEVMAKLDELIAKIDSIEAKVGELETKTSNLSSETEKFNSDIELIKTKANFVKEISKNSVPDVGIKTSPVAEKINKFRQLKK